jgi:hypothetical protein
MTTELSGSVVLDIPNGDELSGWTPVATPRRGDRVALLAVGITVVANLIGWWNPGNFLLVDRVLFHPIAGVMVIVGALSVVAAGRDLGRALKVVGALLVSLLLALLAIAGFVSSVVPDELKTQRVSSEFGDAEARLMDVGLLGGSYEVVLIAHRGVASRENEVLAFDTWDEIAWYAEQSTTAGFDASPIHTTPTMEFVDTDQLVVHVGAAEYRVRFDPETLGVRDVSCEASPTKTDSGAEVTYRCQAF